MASAGLKAKVRSVERQLGTRRTTGPYEGHGWTSREAAVRWMHGDREDGLKFARAYAGIPDDYGGNAENRAALWELVAVMTPDRPFSFDLLPRGLQTLLKDELRERDLKVINAPAIPMDPYGARSLASYIQGDPPQVALTRDRIDAAKAWWEEAVRKSDEMCRKSGLEPRGWAMDWDWWYANSVPPHRPVAVSAFTAP